MYETLQELLQDVVLNTPPPDLLLFSRTESVSESAVPPATFSVPHLNDRWKLGGSERCGKDF